MSEPASTVGLTRPRIESLSLSALPSAAFRLPCRIRFADCDPAGIAYTGRLIDVMNGAIEALFDTRLGLDYGYVIQVRRLGLGYGRVDCDFLRPARFGDQASVTVLIDRLGRSSIAWCVHLHRDEDEMARGQLTTVTTDLTTHRVTAIPEWLRKPLEAYRDACA